MCAASIIYFAVQQRKKTVLTYVFFYLVIKVENLHEFMACCVCIVLNSFRTRLFIVLILVQSKCSKALLLILKHWVLILCAGILRQGRSQMVIPTSIWTCEYSDLGKTKFFNASPRMHNWSLSSSSSPSLEAIFGATSSTSSAERLLYLRFVLPVLIGTHVTSGKFSNAGHLLTSPFESKSAGSLDWAPINVSIKIHHNVFRDITDRNSAKHVMSTQGNSRCNPTDEKPKKKCDKTDICFSIIVMFHTLTTPPTTIQKNAQQEFTWLWIREFPSSICKQAK